MDKKRQNHKVTYFCIAKTEENYISFTKIVVDRFSKIEKDGEVKSIDMWNLTASDSCSHLSATLVSNLHKDDICHLNKYIDNINKMSRKGVFPYD